LISSFLAPLPDTACFGGGGPSNVDRGGQRLLEIATANLHLSTPLLLEKIVEGAKRFSCPEQADDIMLIVARCCA